MLDVPHKQMNATFASAKVIDKGNFDRAGQSTPHIYPEQQVFVNTLADQLTEPVRMTIVLLTKILSKTLDSFRIISATLDTMKF